MDIDAETGDVTGCAVTGRAVDCLPAMSASLTEHAKRERQWGASMAVVLARKGENGLLDEVTDDVLEGCGLRDIAKRLGIPIGELGRFLYLHEEGYRGMMRVKADLLAHETLGIADEGSVEDVAHRKLRIDTRLKLASKWDKTMYGDEKAAVRVDTQITIIHDSQ